MTSKKSFDAIFPLLQGPPPTENIDDPDLVSKRLEWLKQVDAGSQMDFVCYHKDKEPENTFWATQQAVLSLENSHLSKKWRDLEIAAAQKKVEAQTANLKDLCKFYGIAFCKVGKSNSIEFKFGHDTAWEDSSMAHIAKDLAENGFPHIFKPANRQPVSEESKKAVRDGLDGAHKRMKN